MRKRETRRFFFFSFHDQCNLKQSETDSGSLDEMLLSFSRTFIHTWTHSCFVTLVK